MKPIIHIVIQMSVYLITIVVFFDGASHLTVRLGSFYLTLFVVQLMLAWTAEIHRPKIYQRRIKYIFSPHVKYITLFLLFGSIINWLLFQDVEILYHNQYVLTLTSVFLIMVNLLVITILLQKEKNEVSNSEIRKYSQTEIEYNKETSTLIKIKGIDSKLKYPGSVTEKISAYFSGDIIVEPLIRSKGKNNFEEKDCQRVVIIEYLINESDNINDDFKMAYDCLVAGGFLIISYEDIIQFESRIFKNGREAANFIKTWYYYLRFRALPKLPNIIGKIFSKGYKVLSRAEIWGRLVYNGFDMIDLISEKDHCYIIAQKTMTPSSNPNPSFHPLITLNRVTLYGKIIKIHKLRSMYPYSEFIQSKVFESNNLNSIGKFENDFRITVPGKYFRKYWLDEIPQIYDWFRGEIKLVGIRAMSQHFFSLYPDEYKKLYSLVKPGIISPIFDEKTNGFEDIVKIEKAYLESYLKNPLRTDIKYFFITIRQMLSGVRSN